MEKTDHLIGPKELAGFLNVPVTWVYQQTHLRTIPFVKLGKYVRFDPEIVMEHFNRKR